jgi:hypothetical protein
MVLHKTSDEEDNQNETAQRMDEKVSFDLVFSNTKIDTILNKGDELNMPE